jgi:cytidine deaminase
LERHELVFGLVGALGTDVKRAGLTLRQQIELVGYAVDQEPVKLSALMHDIEQEPYSSLYAKDAHGKKYVRAGVETYMKAGTKLRTDLKRADALALLAIRALRSRREALNLGESSANGYAFILDSLKHKSEIEMLRRMYGPAFIAIGVHGTYDDRLEHTQRRLLKEVGNRGSLNDFEADAKRLMQLDEDEKDNSFGQHVSDAFAMADVVISDKLDKESTIRRFVKILFGDWTQTPTRDEVGMYHAQGAAYQSSSMSRQVGAAITRLDGSIVATGTNDVPRFGGGSFDEDELRAGRKDVRDFASGFDTSDQHRREVLIDILERLCKNGVISSFSRDAASEKADSYLYGPDNFMKRAKFMATIDYTRAVHAEATAIANSAKAGVSVENCTLYVTTFPCHDCAKLIVASGITRVVYVEPYTKSLAKDFYDGLISIDKDNRKLVRFEPFIGITPRRFAEFFAMREDRKDALGTRQDIDQKIATPRLPEYFAASTARIASEQVELLALDQAVETAQITFKHVALTTK